MEVEIKEANLKEELLEIIHLQGQNHRDLVSIEEALENGFLSVRHDLTVLEEMNSKAKQIIAKSNGKVVGFALVMLDIVKNSVPAMLPLFEALPDAIYNGKRIIDYKYYVMGQICVSEPFRKSGIFDALYAKHKEIYSKQFDICVTEISSKNLRSLRAHKRVGFEVIHTFNDSIDEWNIVVWDWK